jgi:hypothetical protein
MNNGYFAEGLLKRTKLVEANLHVVPQGGNIQIRTNE